MKKKHLQITEPVFNICMDVFKGYTANEAVGYELDSQAHTRIDTKNRTITIWLGEYAFMGALVHELRHAIYRAVRSRGLSINNKTGEEVVAYLLQYFVNQSLSIFDSWKPDVTEFTEFIRKNPSANAAMKRLAKK